MKNKGGRPLIIDDQKSIEILERHEKGESLSALAKAYNISVSSVKNALNKAKAIREEEKKPFKWLKKKFKKKGAI